MSVDRSHTVAVFRDTVKLHPSSADAWFNLGKALADAGAYGGAVLAYRRCAELDPRDASVQYNLGNTLQRAGDTDAAIAAYRAAASGDPGNASVFINLGIALESAGDLTAAVDAYRQALACDPRSAQAYNNLGNAYSMQALLAKSEEAYRGALRLQPDLVDAWYNLGGVLARQGRAPEAEVAYRGALRLNHEFYQAYVNLAGVVQDLGRTDEAILLLRQAIEIQPSMPEGHFNLALALLQRGMWEEGWQEFAWRVETKEGKTARPRQTLTQWDGVVRAGETILVRAEQGYGDTLQCVRFIPLLAAQGLRIAFECRTELHPLFAHWDRSVELISPDGPAPHAEREIGLFSLPGMLGVTAASVPSAVPYLDAPPGRMTAWQPRVRTVGRLMHVGIVAAGNPAHKNDSNRSIPVSGLLPLFGVQGVAWHTLLPEGDRMALAFPPGVPVVHHGAAIRDFGDSAALLGNLDLLISVDTAPAHLGGALGIPVWLMLPFNPDWRWLLGRTDSPWYPSMRLFRQSGPGDWSPVVTQICEELRTMAAAHRQRGEGQ
jgi:tetratricopeptide (TPR) repeat protein